MASYYIMPLGCDYNQDHTAIGPKSISRCQTALETAALRRTRNEQVTIVLAPGVEKARRGENAKTMATMMYEWFLANGGNDFKFMVNRTEQDIPHSTMGEMGWALPNILADRRSLNNYDNSANSRDCSNTVVVFVSNRRHLRRIRRNMLTLFSDFIGDNTPDGFGSIGHQPYYAYPRYTYVASKEPPPSLLHEALAYTKLLLVKIGLVKP